MANLLKLAGYQTEDMIEKVAEAMDYLEAYGVDPIGGLVTLALTDEQGNVLNEKVASVVENELTPEQSAALVEVAEFLGGVDEDMIKVAEEISAGAEDLMDKVAEYAIYVEEAGMPFEDAMVLASSIYDDGSVDEKVASEAVALGYTDEHLEFAEKVAEAIYAETGLLPEEALALIKEAKISENEVRLADRVIGAAGKAIKRRVKGAWNSYKSALTGKGADKVKSRLSKETNNLEAAKKVMYNRAKLLTGEQDGTAAFKKLRETGRDKKDPLIRKFQEKYHAKLKDVENTKKSLKNIRKRQALAIGGTAAGVGTVGYGAYKAVAGNKDK